MPDKPASMNNTVYDRICHDPSISYDTKTQLIELCEACSNEADVEIAFNDFSQLRRLSGTTIINLVKGEVVGHVKNLRGASNFLSKILGMSIPDVEEHFRNLTGGGTSIQQREASQWFQDEIVANPKEILISGTPCWLFREGGSKNAQVEFEQANVSCLPARLGLPLPEFLGGGPYPDGELEFVGYCVPKSEVNDCRLPSVFDGNYSSVRDVWIVGGRTQPISNAPKQCIDAGGLEELVATPPSLSAVSIVKVFFN